jgi:glutamate-1-semialdehyde aminotransferase
MEALPRIGYSPTYRGEALSLAAAGACLEVHRNEPVAERLAEIGTQLREHFDESLRGLGIAGRLNGPPARMTVEYELAAGFSQLGMRMVLVQQLLAHGVLTTGSFLPSYAHDTEAIELTAHAFCKAHEALEAAVQERDLLKYIAAPPNPLLFEGGRIPERYLGG